MNIPDSGTAWVSRCQSWSRTFRVIGKPVFQLPTSRAPSLKPIAISREREGGLGARNFAVEHRQPEDAPAQDAEHRQQVDEALGGSQL